MPRRTGTTRGFKRGGTLIGGQVRRVSESRGFAVSRVLTHWREIAGDALADISRPVDVSYGRQGFGATLTVLTTGAQAPMLDMQKEVLRAKQCTVHFSGSIPFSNIRTECLSDKITCSKCISFAFSFCQT